MMMSSIPLGETFVGPKSSEETKDCILLSIQIAVKQIQHYASLHDPDDGLSMEIREVHQLCDCLDKTLFHGLKEYQHGYWPFVKEFTHRNTIHFLEDLENACTNLQYGRAWLCLALNENSLESYFRSFHQNRRLVEKHYTTPALLHDEQRMELILMLMAGLEYVPISLALDKANWGSGLSFLGTNVNENFDQISNESASESSQGNSISPSLQESFIEHSTESAIEMTDNYIVNGDCDICNTRKILSKASVDARAFHHHNGFSQCKVAAQELERITRYINITSENEIPIEEDLEVVRAKVVRRVKKSPCRKDSCDSAESKNEPTHNSLHQAPHLADDEYDVKQNRLSKVTTDSGLSLEMHSSSDSESGDSLEERNKKGLSFQINNFQQQIEVTFSTPSQTSNSFGKKDLCDLDVSPVSLSSENLYTEERGVPEGQEDPQDVLYSSICSSDRRPLLPGNDGQDDELEEASIYDVSNKFYTTRFVNAACSVNYHVECKPECLNSQEILDKPNLINGTLLNNLENSYEKSSAVKETSGIENIVSIENIKIVTTKGKSACSEMNSNIQEIHSDSLLCNISMKLNAEDPVQQELALAAKMKQDDLDLRVDKNTLLYLLIEIYEEEEETFYKMFYGFLNFRRGGRKSVLVLLTNKYVYILKSGTEDERFIKHESFLYSNIDFIMVGLNYQEFTILTKNLKQRSTLYTGDEYLTRSIISSIEVAIRRNCPKIELPGVSTDASAQISMLKNFLHKELMCQPSEIEIHHSVLIHWENYDGSASPITPTGPFRHGFLMYRRKHAKDSNMTLWKPGFFLLKGGVLYCMEHDQKSTPLFFVQICVPHCKGCRRLHLPNRPYAFEVILSHGDSLQLAAAGDVEASDWQHAFLQTVSLAGHFIDTERKILNSCCMVIANDIFFVVIEDPRKKTMEILGKASIHDLLTLSTDYKNPLCIVLEFEIAEAINCSGEWVIVFESNIEKEKFLNIAHTRWSAIFELELQMTPITDLSLLKKCRQIADEMASERIKLQELCIDS